MFMLIFVPARGFIHGKNGTAVLQINIVQVGLNGLMLTSSLTYGDWLRKIWVS
jgi:hypothetical protein